MPLSRIAAPAALAGGVLWIVRALLGGGDGPLVDTLQLLGLVCLLVAAALFGSTLVRSDNLGMRVVVALASALLLLAMVEAFRPPGARWYDATWGALAAVVGGVALLRQRGRTPERPATGAHAR